MANRYPLILDSSNNKIKELPSGDNLDLTGAGISSVGSISVGAAVTINGTGADITGVVTATQFVGDGSQLTGVSGFATALSPDTTSTLNKIFKTPKTLAIGTGVSLTIESDESSGNVAFVREGVIHVGSGSTLHIADGTQFHTNVLSVF